MATTIVLWGVWSTLWKQNNNSYNAGELNLIRIHRASFIRLPSSFCVSRISGLVKSKFEKSKLQAGAQETLQETIPSWARKLWSGLELLKKFLPMDNEELPTRPPCDPSSKLDKNYACFRHLLFGYGLF